MFDPDPIHRDMATIFASIARDAEAWPPAKVRAVQHAGMPAEPWQKQAPKPGSRRLRLVLPPLLVAAMLIGFLGGSALDRVGIGHSIRSAISRTGAGQEPVRTTHTAMVAIPIRPRVQPSVEPVASLVPAIGERREIKSPPARHRPRWRRARWHRSPARTSATELADQMRQRAIEEDAAVTRRLNAQVLTRATSRTANRETH